MKRTMNRLWAEDDGFVLSTEMILYGTVGVVGVGAGYTALRDSVNSELTDLAKAIGCMDQSYWIAPVVGHSAWTAGSGFMDRADLCDGPQYVTVPVPAPQCDRPVVCADVFGRSAVPADSIDAVVPHPVPALPGPGAAVVPPHHYHQHHHPHANPHQPHSVRAVMNEPSKGVVIGEPEPACVVGSPHLVPTAYAPQDCLPVNVMVNPWHQGPYLVDVPEGYFNRLPQVWGPAPHYRVMVGGYGAPQDYGYRYAPAATAAAPQSWDTIDLGFAKVGDDELKQVEKFSKAKCLHVLGSNVTDKGLGYIGDMDQLESLHLIGTQITDAGLKELLGLKKLRFLHLVGTKITDAGLKHLAGMKQLEELDVRGTPVTDEGLAALGKELPTLRVVR